VINTLKEKGAIKNTFLSILQENIVFASNNENGKTMYY